MLTPFKLFWRVNSLDEVVFNYHGRVFTLDNLQKSYIAACGGYLNGAWATFMSTPISLIITGIELVCELQKEQNT